MKYEGVVCSRRWELHIVWDTLIGMYDRVYFDVAFLPARLWMTAATFEYQVGEQ